MSLLGSLSFGFNIEWLNIQYWNDKKSLELNLVKSLGESDKLFVYIAYRFWSVLSFCSFYSVVLEKVIELDMMWLSQVTVS